MTKEPAPSLSYAAIHPCSREAVEKALATDNTDVLLRAVIAVSMCDHDWQYAQELCMKLSRHWNFNVRGNAILGFGHIARVHGILDEELVKPVIELALGDENNYVVGHAVDAVMDTEHYLGWAYDQN